MFFKITILHNAIVIIEIVIKVSCSFSHIGNAFAPHPIISLVVHNVFPIFKIFLLVFSLLDEIIVEVTALLALFLKRHSHHPTVILSFLHRLLELLHPSLAGIQNNPPKILHALSRDATDPQRLPVRQTQPLPYSPHRRLDLAPLQLIRLRRHHNERHAHIEQGREHRPIIGTGRTTRIHQQHPQPELASLPEVPLGGLLHALLRLLAELGVPEAGKVGESQNGLGLSSPHVDVVAAALRSSQQRVQVDGGGGAGSFPHSCGIPSRLGNEFVQ
mmetsp:Transcript_9930/g.21473  ORF Transcript_9930/g.21473 Transcript_9930/m.21473 type:complete len:273 (-) Transcript_9930:397-1215(-)